MFVQQFFNCYLFLGLKSKKKLSLVVSTTNTTTTTIHPTCNKLTLWGGGKLLH